MEGIFINSNERHRLVLGYFKGIHHGSEEPMKRWLHYIDSTVLTMAILRFVSSFIELTAAILILVNNDVKKALLINGALAVIGPLVMMASFSIGLVSIVGQLSIGKFVLIITGAIFILIGVLK